MVRLTDAGAVVSCQLEAWFTLAGEGAWDINAAVLAIPVSALIDVCRRKTLIYLTPTTTFPVTKSGFCCTNKLTNTFSANFAVTFWTLAGEGAKCVDALLAGLAVMFVSHTFINIYPNIKIF